MKNIVIGCDSAAVELKDIIKEFLEKSGYSVEYVGFRSPEDKEIYANVAEIVCEKVIQNEADTKGILICGTGIGMCMVANKYKGIRAAVCHDNFSCERSILSNNAHVLCMGARVIGAELAKKIVKEWVTLEYVDGPSTPKIEAIMAVGK